MKNIIKYTLLLMAAGSLLFACRPMDSDSHKLGPAPQDSELAFTATPSSANANIIELTNTSSLKGVALWDLGNGSTAKGDKVSVAYPFKGDYTVTLSLYTTGGGASISKVVSIAADDYGLLDTPGFNALTGGADAVDGKTWVFSKYIKGHMGVGDVNAAPEVNGPSWWQCDPLGKEGASLYDNEFTFIQKGTKFVWKNKGFIYTNANGMNHLGIQGQPSPIDDYDVPYVPADNYTFSLDENAGVLTLSGNAFLGHYAGTSTYYILKLDEHELVVWCKSAAELGNAWYYRFVPKDELKEPEPGPGKEAEYVPVSLSEDFEGELSFEFEMEDMGELTGVYSNPSPFPSNTSSKVFAYQKTTAFYGNISYLAEGKKFDLTENNKVRVQVLVPSKNDWDTEAEVAGDWITNNKLLPQLAVKLQNSDKGGDAWQTQTEIVKTIDEFDTWVDLEFDFSEVAERTDYDKIVLQFGAEGHAAPGLFFFDNFEFDK